jgi:hypothetical protein
MRQRGPFGWLLNSSTSDSSRPDADVCLLAAGSSFLLGVDGTLRKQARSRHAIMRLEGVKS